jgi:uncharacterized protein (DUF433 family)
MGRVDIGDHIVSDPGIRHGELAFRGTRILVRAVRQWAAEGPEWDKIVWECSSAVSRQVIGEAVRLVSQALREQAPMQTAA